MRKRKKSDSKRMLCIPYNLGWISEQKSTMMGIAILWIVFFHGSWDLDCLTVLPFLKKYGNIGVDIFLLLSGMGLYYSWLWIVELDHGLGESTEKPIILFYRRRLIRIMPATIICLLPWYLYLYRNQWIHIGRFVLDITSVSYWIDGTNRGWYIALTIILYLIYPFVHVFMHRDPDPKKKINSCLLIAVSLIINITLCLAFPKWYATVELALSRIPVFLLGCAIAPMIREKRENRRLLVVCAVMTPALWLALELYKDHMLAYSIWRYVYGAFAFSLTVVLSWLLHVSNNKKINRFFSHMGEYTLEIYLIHTQVLTVMTEQIPSMSSWIVNMAAVLVSFILAICMHKLFKLLYICQHR